LTQVVSFDELAHPQGEPCGASAVAGRRRLAHDQHPAHELRRLAGLAKAQQVLRCLHGR
jgi:hypothetical protein